MDSPHLTDEQLLLHADGELAHHESHLVRAHLEACWSCRARLDDLQASIHTVARFLSEVVLPGVPPPPGPWRGLGPRLAALHSASRRPSMVARLRRVWHTRALILARAARIGAALLLATIVAIWWARPAAVSAQELLTRADAALVVSAHRQLVLEERVPSRGIVLARRQVDIWQNAKTGVKARRVYDDQQRLLAAEWTMADGSRTVYRPGMGPRDHHQDTGYALRIEDLWRAEPSATDFRALIGDANPPRVDGPHRAYIVTWVPAHPVSADYLVSVSLMLDETGTHPIGQAIEIREANEIREFRLTETTFTRLDPDAIPVSALEPERDLLAAPLDVRTGATPPSVPRSAISPSALIDLEIETLTQLNRVGAFLGEQIAVERDVRHSHVRVDGVVDTAARKRELLDALEPVGGQGTIRANIRTIDEALQHRRAPPPASTPVTPLDADEQKPIPVSGDLRRYVEESQRRHAPDDSAPDLAAVQREIQRITVGVLQQSLKARLHARALIQVLERFSPDDVRSLSPISHHNWHLMIREHASAFQRETEGLRQVLQPIFPAPTLANRTAADAEEIQVASDSDLSRAATRLFELGSFHDAEVARAFSISVGARSADPPEWHAFYHSLRAAERLAARIGQLSAAQ